MEKQEYINEYIDTLKAKIDELNLENSNLKVKYNDLESENDELEWEIDELEDKIYKLEWEIEELKDFDSSNILIKANNLKDFNLIKNILDSINNNLIDTEIEYN